MDNGLNRLEQQSHASLKNLQVLTLLMYIVSSFVLQSYKLPASNICSVDIIH